MPRVRHVGATPHLMRHCKGCATRLFEAEGEQNPVVHMPNDVTAGLNWMEREQFL